MKSGHLLLIEFAGAMECGEETRAVERENFCIFGHGVMALAEF